MQRGRHGHTEAVQTPGGQPGVDQEHQVQAQQRQGEVDEDLRGVVPTELSGTEMEEKQKVREGENKKSVHVLDSSKDRVFYYGPNGVM